MYDPSTTSPAPSQPLRWVFLAALIVALWFCTRGWHASILDRHEFRQTQTAISAYWIKVAGYHLDYETPLFGPPWSIPLEFPLYQWLVAGTSTVLGADLEACARGVSLFFFIATLPAVYGLCGLITLPSSRRLLVLGVILISPTYLFWARTFMIETTALCLATWFLFTLVRSLKTQSIGWAIGASVAGIAAALTKVTTLMIFCLPAGAFCLWQLRIQAATQTSSLFWRSRTLLFAGIPTLLSVATGYAWIRHADQVKHTNAFAEFLVSSNLTSFTWGTLAQRFSLQFWSGIWTNLSELMLGEAALAVMILGWALSSADCRRAALWCGAFFVCGILLFSNLFFFHDYYYCATALFLYSGAGIILVGIWDNVRLPLAVRALLLAIFFASQLRLYERSFGFYADSDLPPPPEIASVIRDTVPSEGVLLIYGWDWNSLVPYYAERRAVMIPRGRETETKVLAQILERLPPRRIAALVVRHAEFQATPAFIREQTHRFGLQSFPFATSPGGDLYLPKAAADRAKVALAGKKFKQVDLPVEPVAPSYADELKEADLSGLNLSFLRPAPVRVRNLYGFSNSQIEGQPVLNAHAPAEIWLVPPAGATHLTAEFGLAEGSYTGEPPLTDGIGVTISEIQEGKEPRVLFRRVLDPVRIPADRGMQRVDLPSAGPFTGQLLFAVDAGPKDSPVKDWAYWASIRFR